MKSLFYSLFVITLFLSVKEIKSEEFQLIDLLYENWGRAVDLQIQNDSIIIQNSNRDKIDIYVDGKMDSILFDKKPEAISGIVYINENLIYSVDDTRIRKFNGSEWTIVDEEFGEFSLNMWALPNLKYNPYTDQLYLTRSSSPYIIENDKIRKIVIDEEPLEYFVPFIGGHVTHYLGDDFYYFNGYTELIKILDDGLFVYNRDDYFLSSKSIMPVNGVLTAWLDKPFKDKLWFATYEGNIVSFDGENFVRNGYVLNGPGKDRMFQVSKFGFDNNEDLWVHVEFYKDTIIDGDNTFAFESRHLYKFDSQNNYESWSEIDYKSFLGTSKDLEETITDIQCDLADPTNKKVYFLIRAGVLIYDPITGIHEVENLPTSNLNEAYPNPVKEQLKIRFGATPSTVNDLSVTVYDLDGNVKLQVKPEVLSYDGNTGIGECSLDVSALNSGVHLIIFSNGEYTHFTKIVKTY